MQIPGLVVYNLLGLVKLKWAYYFVHFVLYQRGHKSKLGGKCTVETRRVIITNVL